MKSWTLLRTLAIVYIVAEGFLTPGVGIVQGHAQAACSVGAAPSGTPSTKGTMANQPTDQVLVTGGCIDSTPIGANTASTVAATTLNTSSTATMAGTNNLTGQANHTAPLTSFGNVAGVPTHIVTQQATAPALTSCGGGSPAITGTDTAGIVTMGTTATGCVITFNVAYTGTPYCVVSWIATPLVSQSYVTSNAAITTTQTSASGNKLQYVCFATAGG